MSKRTYRLGKLLVAVALAEPLVWAQQAGQERHVRQERLSGTIEKLSEHGRNPEGGVSRVGFTEADLAGRAYVMGLMREAGLAVRVDPAGNIFGRRDGGEKLPVLLFGSHIDSVPHGGNFDGDVGSLGAIEVIRALNENGVKTRHPLEVVVWSNEEGGRFYSMLFGSSAAAGLLPSDPMWPTRRTRRARRCASGSGGWAETDRVSPRRRFRRGESQAISNCTSSRERCWTRRRFPSGLCWE